jgi:hypothetical protein
LNKFLEALLINANFFVATMGNAQMNIGK